MDPTELANGMANLGLLLIALSVALAVMIIVFLAIRSLVLWYWRVNEVLASIRALHEQLALINRNLESIECGLARLSAHSSQSQVGSPRGAPQG